MIEFYAEIKTAHVAAVVASGSLFALRGSMMLAHSPLANHAALRYASYAIDTTLLTAALMLATILHQYPFVHAWLTVKVLLLIVYIALGSLALKRAQTRRAQVVAFAAAIAIFLLIASVARAHHPLGIVYTLAH